MWARRNVLGGGLAMALLGCAGRTYERGARDMYGLIGKITSTPGDRAALLEALTSGSGEMPGNLAYLVAEDAADRDVIWVTEAWDSEESHKASLQLPQVQEAIRRGRPLIAGFETVATTRPVAGVR